MKTLSLFFGVISICSMAALGQERQDVETRQQELMRRQSGEEANRKVQHQGGPLNTVEQWRIIELTFTSSKSYGNPVTDVNMTATFTNGDTTIMRPAFWDGGNIWKIRFAPTRTGTWSYTTNCEDASNSGLHNQTGTVQANAYSGSLDIYKHGFLRVSDNHHFLTYADGTPFFYLGEHHRMAAYERWNSCNYPGCLSQFRFEADKRVSQALTVYQTEWQNTPNEEGFFTGLSDCAIQEKDLPGFQSADQRIGYLADKGLVDSLEVASGPDAPNCSDTFLRKYGQYWAARYGAYPILWATAGEVDGLNSIDPPNLDKKWQVVGQALRDYDGYNHPLSAQMWGGILASTSTWKNLYFHDWFAAEIQAGNMDNTSAFNLYSSNKPVVWYEPPFENYWTDRSGERLRAYTAYLSGWYGFGYGVAGVWDDNYQCSPVRDSGTAYDPICKEWYNGLFRESGNDMTRLANFFKPLEWWKLTPRFTDSSWVSFADPDQSRLASSGSDVYVAYFYGQGTGTGTLKNMDPASTYVAKWYDPRAGTYQPIGSFVPASGEWNAPNKPDENDWVLLVQRNFALSINGGSAYTNNRMVELALFPLGANNVLSMHFSSDGNTWTAAEPFAPQKSWSLPEGDGTKTGYVRFNIAGIWSSAYTSIITLDTAAPTVSIVSPSNGEINTNSPLLNYSASEGAITVSMDGIIIHKNSGEHFGPLANGTHTLVIESTDAAGNIGSASRVFTVQAVRPTVVITSPLPATTPDNTPTLSYTVSCCSAIVTVDGNLVPTLSGSSLDPLPNGSHTLSVQAKDSAGSTATASVDFSVEHTPLEIDNGYWQSGLLNSTFNLKLAAYGGVTGLGYPKRTGWRASSGSNARQ